MSYIKKTHIVKIRNVDATIKTVRCPYCHTFLEPIPKYVTAMLCWYCKKEFRIEQDSNRYEDSNVGSRNRIRGRE